MRLGVARRSRPPAAPELPAPRRPGALQGGDLEHLIAYARAMRRPEPAVSGWCPLMTTRRHRAPERCPCLHELPPRSVCHERDRQRTPTVSIPVRRDYSMAGGRSHVKGGKACGAR